MPGYGTKHLNEDKDGEYAGIPYDGTLKEDGKGMWWKD